MSTNEEYLSRKFNIHAWLAGSRDLHEDFARLNKQDKLFILNRATDQVKFDIKTSSREFRDNQAVRIAQEARKLKAEGK